MPAFFKYFFIFKFYVVFSEPIGKNCKTPPNLGNFQPQLDLCESKYLQIARKRFEKNILLKFYIFLTFKAGHL